MDCNATLVMAKAMSTVNEISPSYHVAKLAYDCIEAAVISYKHMCFRINIHTTGKVHHSCVIRKVLLENFTSMCNVAKSRAWETKLLLVEALN